MLTLDLSVLLFVSRILNASFFPVLDVEEVSVRLDTRSIRLCESRTVSRDSMLAVRFRGF